MSNSKAAASALTRVTTLGTAPLQLFPAALAYSSTGRHLLSPAPTAASPYESCKFLSSLGLVRCVCFLRFMSPLPPSRFQLRVKLGTIAEHSPNTSKPWVPTPAPHKPGRRVACNASTGEVDAGESGDQDHPGLLS